MNRLALPLVLALASACLPTAARAADAAAIRAAITKATAFLEKHQAADGSFSAEVGPAVTALAVNALARSGARCLDESALLFERILVSAGQRGLQIEIDPRALGELTGARFADIV